MTRQIGGLPARPTDSSHYLKLAGHSPPNGHYYSLTSQKSNFPAGESDQLLDRAIVQRAALF